MVSESGEEVEDELVEERSRVEGAAQIEEEGCRHCLTLPLLSSRTAAEVNEEGQQGQGEGR